MCPLHRHERPHAQLGALRWQQLGKHGFARQRVTEPESLPVHRDQLGLDGATQRPDRRRGVDRGDARQQIPVKTPPQHGRGGEHLPTVGVERVEPGAQRSSEAGGYRRCGCLLRPPPPVLPDQRSRGDQPRQQLLDQERQPVAVLGDERRHGTVDVGAGQAGAHHVRALGVGQGSEGKDRADPPALQPVEHIGDVRGADRPSSGEAQHPLGGDAVSEVVDDLQRLRVRPVEVFEHEQTPGGAAEHTEQPDDRLTDEQRGAVSTSGRVARAPVRHESGELAGEPDQLG